MPQPPSYLFQVLVMCFAVFLGSWSPSSLSIGYSSVSSVPIPVAPQQHPVSGLGVAPQQPQAKDPTVGAYGAYATPNSKY